MGNIKSLHSDQDTSERVLSVVNDNIKKLTTHPEYNNSPRGRDIVEQLLSIIVNAGDQHDLSENMKNENLQMFINPLSQTDIKTLCGNSTEVSEGNIELSPVETCRGESPSVGASENLSKSLKSIINENIRIVKKLPSFSHDEISQMSVKLVKDILQESADDEEILKRLGRLQLIYFTKSDKTEFWSMKEEIMNRIVMETLEEDEEIDDEEKEVSSKSTPPTAVKIELSEPSCDSGDNSKHLDNITITEDLTEAADSGNTDMTCQHTEPPHHEEIQQEEIEKPIQIDSIPQVEVEVRETIEQRETLVDDLIGMSEEIDASPVIDIPPPLDNTEVEEQSDDKCANIVIPSTEEMVEDQTPSEEERVNLIGIINRNISKLCREHDYSQNETAQRKVRTLYNIITESGSAGEIYDQIQLEGLQYFAEYQADTNTNKSGEQENSKSPSASREKERNNSIVSKILEEAMQNKTESDVLEIKKSSTVGEDLARREEKAAQNTLTRDKASRKVKKFVR